MHLQPKAVDTSQSVLDIHKARNANELITVIGRINASLRIHQHAYGRMVQSNTSSLSEACSLLTKTLQTQQELQAAFAVTSSLSDVKRERCVTAITGLNAEVLSLKRSLMSIISAESKGTVSAKLDKYVNLVHDTLRRISSKIYLMTMYDGNSTYVAVIAKQVQLPSGFTSPEVCVKLAENADGFRVCLPSSTFVDAEYTVFAGSKALRDFLALSLDYDTKAAPVKASSIPHLDGVTSVDVTDTLNVNFDKVAKASEINALLKVVIPLVKKAVGASGYDILHRVLTTPEGRTLQLSLGSRKLVDTASLNRLYRVLKLQKATASAATSLMEPK